jgi:hypothetical protein
MSDHRSPKVHRDPPTTPPPPLVDDGYCVEPERVRRRRYQGWELDQPTPHWFAWWGLGVCVGIILLALLIVLGEAIDDPASRSGQTTDPIDLSRASSAALSGVPTSLPVRTEAPVPSPSAAPTSVLLPATVNGWAAWCAPTPARCLGWGGADAKVAGVPSFRDGDEPYPVRVIYGKRSVLVIVVSYCACGDREGIPTVIDLSPAAMAELEPDYVRIGIIRVVVEDLRGFPLPRTDVPDQHPEDPPEHPDDARMRFEVRD